MAGSLIKLDEKIASGDASITLGTSNWDSSYDVYMVKIFGLNPATGQVLRCRLTENGTDNISNLYTYSAKGFKTTVGFENNNAVSSTYFDISDSYVNSTIGNFNAVMYIFGANNSSEWTHITFETSHYAGAELYGNQGAGALKVTSAVNGITFYINAINIDSGTFTLYGLKK